MKHKRKAAALCLLLAGILILHLTGCGRRPAAAEAEETPEPSDPAAPEESPAASPASTEPGETPAPADSTEPEETEPTLSSQPEPGDTEPEPGEADPTPAASEEARPERLPPVNLMANITAAAAEPAPADPESSEAAVDFALRLFRAGFRNGENTLLSPLSVLNALGMTANGAAGETLAQMEDVFGLDRDQLNRYLRRFPASSDRPEDSALRQANSIWFNAGSGFTVDPAFLQTNADWYGADLFLACFDQATLGEINGWVNEKTDGMIPAILDRVPADAVMYLINALAFEADWERPYRRDDVRPGEFTAANGTKRNVEFLVSKERLYLENELAVGFLKPYAGGKYAFAALLPQEDVSLESLVDSLSGASLQALFGELRTETVSASLPKFETSWSAELSGLLRSLGMELPFDAANADFSGMGTADSGGLSISRVLHKTSLSVTEQGTRAGAATAVEMLKGISLNEHQVVLDRPFVYMIVDGETFLPIFIGVLADPGKGE